MKLHRAKQSTDSNLDAILRGVHGRTFSAMDFLGTKVKRKVHLSMEYVLHNFSLRLLYYLFVYQ